MNKDKDCELIVVLKINSLIFLFLIPLAYFFLFLEAYSYIGFLRKFFLVDSRFFLAVSLISALGVVFQRVVFGRNKRIYQENKLTPFVFRFNFILTPVFLAFYFILVGLETKNYTNYVFSTYHLQPDNFFNLVLFSVALSLIGRFYFSYYKGSEIVKDFLMNFHSNLRINLNLRKIKIQPREFFARVLFLVSVFLLVVYFLQNLSKTLSLAIKNDIYILTHLNASYDEKMTKKWGLLYRLISLIDAETTRGNSILFPDGDPPHSVDGRIEYYRYFLNDRDLVHFRDDDVYKYDYILLAKGYLHEVYDGKARSDYIWPDFPVNSEKIVLIESIGDQWIKKIYYQDYNPQYFKDREVWGLIKIKRI